MPALVICGVSGVRYLLAMQCPLALAALLYLAFSGEWKQFRRQFGTDTGKKSFRQVWKSGRAAYLYCGLLGAGGSLLGYCLNVLWVSRQYMNTNRFSPRDTARNSATKNLCPQLPLYAFAPQ